MRNIRRLMYCTPKMSDNAYSLHCYDTADNNVKVHWHYMSPKCARPGCISCTLCLNAPFARVCENFYLYDMAHVIIKCRVTLGKKMLNDCIKPHSICMWLVLSTQEEFSLKRAHYGHSPLNILPFLGLRQARQCQRLYSTPATDAPVLVFDRSEAIIIKKRSKKTTRKKQRTEMTQRRYSVFIKVKPCIFFAAFYCRFALFICVFFSMTSYTKTISLLFSIAFSALKVLFL